MKKNNTFIKILSRSIIRSLFFSEVNLLIMSDIPDRFTGNIYWPNRLLSIKIYTCQAENNFFQNTVLSIKIFTCLTENIFCQTCILSKMLYLLDKNYFLPKLNIIDEIFDLTGRKYNKCFLHIATHKVFKLLSGFDRKYFFEEFFFFLS